MEFSPTNRYHWRFQERIGTRVGLEEGLEPGAKHRLPGADLVEKSFALWSPGPLEGLAEENFFLIVSRFHKGRRLLLQVYMGP